MKTLAVAIYARVSSDQQAQARTIGSQVAALRARVTADGCVVFPECEFIDEGYSGATLVRPGLERLRGRCQLIHISTIAGSRTEGVTTCFSHAARERLVISRQLWNRCCIS
jgi:site-specific DNA recombinase